MNFDPVDDADDAVVFGAMPDPAVRAEPGSDFYRVCSPGELCEVDCSAAATCFVDCAAASQCDITCAPGDCAVTGCDHAPCAVDCGTSDLYNYGNTMTCSP